MIVEPNSLQTDCLALLHVTVKLMLVSNLQTLITNLLRMKIDCLDQHSCQAIHTHRHKKQNLARLIFDGNQSLL